MVTIAFIIGKETVLLRSSDYSGFELCWQRIQKGELVWTPEKFYASIVQALQSILQLKIRAADACSVKELKATIENAMAEINETWPVMTAMKR